MSAARDHAGEDELIELVLPARTEMAATLRVVMASLGADVGLSVDEIDDLRLAVSEVFGSAADAPDGRRVSVGFRPAEHSIEVVMSMTSPNPDDRIVLDELATTILRSVVDDYREVGGSVRFVKRAAETLE
jgi:anti-sigma regulatory factor (Ser/Thr protein kinase)